MLNGHILLGLFTLIEEFFQSRNFWIMARESRDFGIKKGWGSRSQSVI
jgi:hypothetical protein